MKKIKIFILGLLTIVMFVSCAPSKINDVTSNKESSNVISNKTEPVSSTTVKKEYLDGYGCRTLYKYELYGTEKEVENLRLKNNKTLEESMKTLILSDDFGIEAADKRLKGRYSTLTVELVSKSHIVMDPYSIMILQAFKKDEFKDNTYILIDDKEYKPESLKNDIMYEDDKLVVYNFTEKATNLKAEEYIDSLKINAEDNIDWMKNLYQNLLKQQKSIFETIDKKE